MSNQSRLTKELTIVFSGFQDIEFVSRKFDEMTPGEMRIRVRDKSTGAFVIKAYEVKEHFFICGSSHFIVKLEETDTEIVDSLCVEMLFPIGAYELKYHPGNISNEYQVREKSDNVIQMIVGDAYSARA